MKKKSISSDYKTQEAIKAQEKIYQDALTALENIKKSDTNQPFHSQIEAVTNQVQALKDKEPTEDLITALKETAALLEKKISIDKYKETANMMQGKPSQGLQMLGGLMLTLAVAILVVFVLAAIVAMVTGGATAITVAGGALATLVVFEPILSVFGLFESKKTGLCDAMYNIAERCAVS